MRIFSSSELVETHIIPLKVRLAVAFKEEAKWQVFVRDCEDWILLLYGILILYWAYTSNFVVYCKKNGTKKQKTAWPGVEPGLSARSSNSLTTAPEWHTWFEKFILLYQNNFFSAIDAVWSWWSCIYREFKAISHYFGFNGPTRCR